MGKITLQSQKCAKFMTRYVEIKHKIVYNVCYNDFISNQYKWYNEKKKMMVKCAFYSWLI